MAAGRLTEVIAIDAQREPAPGVEAAPEWIEIGRLRAEVKPVRATESEREGALRTVQVYLCTVWTSELIALRIRPSHRIRWRTSTMDEDLVMNVREVRTPPDRTMMTEIVGESGVTL